MEFFFFISPFLAGTTYNGLCLHCTCREKIVLVVTFNRLVSLLPTLYFLHAVRISSARDRLGSGGDTRSSRWSWRSSDWRCFIRQSWATKTKCGMCVKDSVVHYHFMTGCALAPKRRFPSYSFLLFFLPSFFFLSFFSAFLVEAFQHPFLTSRSVCTTSFR